MAVNRAKKFGAISKATFELRLPPYWIPPDRWRARFVELRHRLRDPGDPLTQGLTEARRLVDNGRDHLLGGYLRPLKRTHRDLLPGRAGAELLEALARDSELQPYRAAGTLACDIGPRAKRDPFELVDIFHIPVPRFTARRPHPGRQNRYASRTRWSCDVPDRVLDLLRGDPPNRLPLAQASLPDLLPGLTPKQISDLLGRLRDDLGANIPSSSEQKQRVQKLRSFLLRAAAEEPREWKQIAKDDVCWCTGVSEELLRHEGLTRAPLSRRQRKHYVEVPRRLILTEPRTSSVDT